MTARLDGKICVVTGAGGDIGLETVALMAARGASIVAVDIDAAGLARAKARVGGAPFLGVEADVTREAQVANFVTRAKAEFGRIDVLFNNAGVEGGPSAAWRLTPDVSRSDFDRVFAVNVTGVFLGMKHVIPAMVEAGQGSIINTASVAGIRPGPGQIAYAASKAAVMGMTRTAALEWGEKGVRVNCINPGPLEGRMMEQIVAGMAEHRPGGEPPGIRGDFIPMGRWGRPSEIAGVVVFLASDASSFITGALHPIDGGMTA